jgi:hypothetical protein
MVFIAINALHVSSGSPAHHQELKTVYTALSLAHTKCCVYGFEFLMMGGGTA